MKRKIMMVAVVISAAFICAMGGTSTWRSGSTGGWNDPNSWDGGVPGAEDTVAVPDNVDLPVTDDDVSYVGAVAAIELGSGSRIVFNLESSNCDVNGTITGSGSIVKNGSGTTVHLKSVTVNGYQTTGGMVVNAGTLECPQTITTSGSDQMKVGPLHVEDGATFIPYAKYRTTTVSSLTGDGRIAHDTASGGYWPFRIQTSSRSTFAGRLGGYMKLYLEGPVDLTGTASTFFDGVSFYPGSDVGIAKFGNRDETSSSIGSGYRTYAGTPRQYKDPSFEGICAVRYLGTGEKTDKNFVLNGGASLTIDAGATGNLTLAGKIYQSTAERQAVVTFSGSNTVASAFTGAFDEYGDNSTYLAKSGTGTWTLYGATNRLNAGVVGVEEGTLRFDTLNETNVPCSFGLSMRLAQKYTGNWDASKTADYAILLGSADAEGVLEWAGTNLWDNAASTRPVAVTGKGGRIVVNGVNRCIGLKGAFAADAGGGTLTLTGDGTTNYLYNVSDGHGKMSLAKSGNGTWVLAGDQTFSGMLVVTGGEVVVSSTQGTEYKWFRYTVKHTRCADDKITVWNDAQVRIAELALYDSSGNRLNRSFADAGNRWIPGQGQASLWMQSSPNPDGYVGTEVVKLFDESYASGHFFSGWCGGSAPRTNNVASWIPIVMRLPQNAAAVASYDVCTKQGYNYSWTPMAWTMEASADGLFWDLVHEVKSNTVEFVVNSWMSNGQSFSANAKRTGFAFGLDKGKSLISGTPSQLANATVSVANGAVLRAEGNVTIKSLEVDVTKPAGTVDGFAFATGGTLTVSGLDRLGSLMELPINLTNVSDASNVSGWTATLDNGRSVKARFANGRIAVYPRGLEILFF